MVQLPEGSCYLDNEKPEKRKSSEPIVSADMVVNKKIGLGGKLVKMFVAEDAKTIKDTIVNDYIIPAIKDVIHDTITKTTDMIFYGETRSTKISGTKSYSSYSAYTPYSAYYGNPNRSSSLTKGYDNKDEDYNRVIYEYEPVIIKGHGKDSMMKAEEVRHYIIDTLNEYHNISVLELYSKVSRRAPHTFQKYGWDNLSHIEIVRVPEGYLIDLPKPVPL